MSFRFYEENGYGYDLTFLPNHLALIECFISYKKWCRAKSSAKTLGLLCSVFWRQGKWTNPRNRWNVRRIIDNLVQNTHPRAFDHSNRKFEYPCLVDLQPYQSALPLHHPQYWKESTGRRISAIGDRFLQEF